MSALKAFVLGMGVVFSLSVFSNRAQAASAACKVSSGSSWKWSRATLTSKAKVIFVVRVLARIGGPDKNVYRLETVHAIKGKRVEQTSFELPSARSKIGKDTFNFEMGPNCKARGNLVTDHLYILYPDLLENMNAIIPVKDLNDPAIDEIADLIAAEKAKSKAKE